MHIFAFTFDFQKEIFSFHRAENITRTFCITKQDSACNTTDKGWLLVSEPGSEGCYYDNPDHPPLAKPAILYSQAPNGVVWSSGNFADT